MLNIGPHSMAAFEAAVARKDRQAFPAWLRQHRALLGDIVPGRALKAYDGIADEVTKSGIDTAERRYSYTAARPEQCPT